MSTTLETSYIQMVMPQTAEDPQGSRFTPGEGVIVLRSTNPDRRKALDELSSKEARDLAIRLAHQHGGMANPRCDPMGSAAYPVDEQGQPIGPLANKQASAIQIDIRVKESFR